MVYSITRNIKHSGLERKGNGVIICHLLNVAIYTCTYILLSIKCTPTRTSKEFLKRFGYTVYATQIVLFPRVPTPRKVAQRFVQHVHCHNMYTYMTL